MSHETLLNVDYFDLDGPIVACVGERAFKGMFKFDPVSNVWELLDPSSEKFDAYHQAIYRNFRAEYLDSTTVLKLPPLLAIVRPGAEQESSELMKNDYPKVAALLEQMGGAYRIFIVLREDTYESSQGDGCFRYFDSAFLKSDDADDAANRINNETNLQAHVLICIVSLFAGSANIHVHIDKQINDRVSALEVISFIEARI